MKVVNEPTPLGWELGFHLARFADAEEKKMPLANGLSRCHDCAFRQGTYPNGCEPTLADALKCILGDGLFLCHENGGPCAGWALLKRGAPKLDLSWPFSDEATEE